MMRWGGHSRDGTAGMVVSSRVSKVVLPVSALFAREGKGERGDGMEGRSG